VAPDVLGNAEFEGSEEEVDDAAVTGHVRGCGGGGNLREGRLEGKSLDQDLLGKVHEHGRCQRGLELECSECDQVSCPESI